MPYWASAWMDFPDDFFQHPLWYTTLFQHLDQAGGGAEGKLGLIAE